MKCVFNKDIYLGFIKVLKTWLLLSNRSIWITSLNSSTKHFTLHKKRSFLLRISLVTVSKYAESCDLVTPTKKSGSSPAELFLGKGVLKICYTFKGEHACRSAISIKLESNFNKITLRHRCSSIHLLHIFRTAFPKNTFRRLLSENP